MNRRTLLKSTGAGALMLPLSGLIMPCNTRAAKPVSTRGVWATKFPANVLAENQGTIKNLPFKSSRVYLDYRYRCSVLPVDAQVLFISGIGPANSGWNHEFWGQSLQVSHASVNGQLVLFIRMCGPIAALGMPQPTFDAWGGPLRADNVWHRMSASIDASTQYVRMAHDGISVNVNKNIVGTGHTCRWDGRIIRFGSVGLNPNQRNTPQLCLEAALAEFFVWTDVAPDPMDPTLNANFTDPDTGLAIRMTPDGGTAFGDQKPVMGFWGGASSFFLNTPNYDFTWNSAVDGTGEDRNAFDLVAGAPLQTAKTDPWEFTGE